MTEEIVRAEIDGPTFRRVLGHYPTGVCVITAMDPDDGPLAMVVGSFTSLSLDPPLVAFSAAHSSQTWPRIRRTERFRVNVLGSHQRELCRRFSSPGPDKFADLELGLSSHGSPILDDVVAWIECSLETVLEAGDHDIAVGRVIALDVARGEAPLLFYQGAFGTFAAHA